MIATVLMDVGRSTDQHAGWHCLQCGEVVDAGIATNRKGHLEPKRSGARPPGSPAVSLSNARRKRRGA
jgi:hypothetical protein